MADMVEVVIDSIRVSLVSQQQVILLRQRQTNRYLPIWIGAFEANAIQLALHEVELARPMTHDLMRHLMETLGATLERAEIVALKESTFYGNLVVRQGTQIYNIDARPSDAIALAVRMHAPIYVAADVMAEAGIVPDEALEEGEEAPAADTAPPTAPEPPAPASASVGNAPAPPEDAPTEDMSERLSVFADFLESIDSADEEGDQPEGREHDDE